MSQIYLPVSSSPAVATTYVTDSGTATPAANILNVVTPGGGTQGIKTTGSGNTITITITETNFSGTATTTGTSSAVLNVNIPLTTSDSSMTLFAQVVGYDITSNLAVGGELIGTFKNVGGTVSGSGKVDITQNSDDNIADATFTFIFSGTNIQLQVTGTANGGGSEVIHWKGNIQIVTVS